MKMYQGFSYDIQCEFSINSGKEIIREYAVIFKYTGNSAKVEVPSEIEGFPVVKMSGAFINIIEVEEIVLPNTLETIFGCCFINCKNLKKINLPESLILIGYYAFVDCFSLEKVSCPNNIEWAHNLQIGDRYSGHEVFVNCSKLYDENGFFILSSLLIAFDGKSKEITIPDGVTKIGDCTFYRDKKLKSVTMPDTVTAIGVSAFCKCTSLTNITFSNNIKRIEDLTFFNCKSLKNVDLPENLESIQYSAFSKCTSFTEIHIPDKVTDICSLAFSVCSSLQKVTIPESVNMISAKAFNRCENLGIVKILPKSRDMDCLLTIQLGSFNYTSKMRENLLQNGMEIHESIVCSFNKADEEKYRLDQLCIWEKISQSSKEFFIEEWSMKISPKSKKGKNKLRNLVFLKSTAKEMSYYFDAGCILELSELDEYIAFSIENKNTVETALLLDYKNKTFDSNFLQEQETHKEMIEIGLTLPTLKELREKWTVVVKKEYLTITGYKGKNKTEVLPATIDNGRPILYIGKGNFGCLEELILSYGFIGILDNAFFNNFFFSIKEENKINKITFPDSIVEIGENSFYRTYITEIILPDGIETLNESVFSYCGYLKKIKFPSNLKIIKANAFSYCNKLQEIVLPDKLKVIQNYAFSYCENLTEITIPDSVETILDYAFSNCTNLVKVNLPKTLSFIPETVFVGCSKLEFIGCTEGENIIDNFIIIL